MHTSHKRQPMVKKYFHTQQQRRVFHRTDGVKMGNDRLIAALLVNVLRSAAHVVERRRRRRGDGPSCVSRMYASGGYVVQGCKCAQQRAHIMCLPWWWWWWCGTPRPRNQSLWTRMCIKGERWASLSSPRTSGMLRVLNG